MYFGKCLAGASGCCGCGKNDHKVRNFPTLGDKGRESKKAPPNGMDVSEQKNILFYFLQANKKTNPIEGVGNL